MTNPSNARKALTTRSVMLPLGVGTAVSLLGDSTLYTVLPDPSIANQVGISLAMVGVLLGVNRLVRLVSNPVAGMLYDRSRRKPLLIGSLGLGIISTCLFAVGRGFAPLFGSRILWGIAWSGIWIGGNTVVLDIAQDSDRGRLSGRYLMWFYIGVGSSALLGGLFTDLLGFRKGLMLSAALTLGAMALWFLMLPETGPDQAGKRDQDKPDRPFPWSVALAISVPVFTIRFVFAGVLASTTILWLSSFVGEAMRIGDLLVPIATLTGVFAAVRTLTGIGGAPLGGVLSDRLGTRWVVVGSAFLIGAVGLWLMGYALIPVAVFGAILAAMTGGGIQALAPAIAGDAILPAQQGRVLSVIFSIGDVGSALGPPVALVLLGWFEPGQVYQICSGLMLAVGVFSLWMEVVGKRRLPG